MACEADGIWNMLNPDVDRHERIWWQLTAEANQAWKDTNDVLFSHQPKYDAKLTEFITEIEKITEAAHCFPEAGLCVTLHIVESLPTIPMDLCFCSVIPMLLAYCPESYSLQTWDPMVDGDYLLDTNARSQAYCRGSLHASKVAPPWIATTPTVHPL